MTTYALPAAPDSPVWLLDHPEHGGPLRFDPAVGVDTLTRTWRNAAHGIELGWVELLALGDVEDEFPGEYNIHGTATPWELGTERTVLDATGEEVFYVSGTATSTDEDVELAKLIVELVNRHAAHRVEVDDLLTPAAAPGPVSDKTRRWLRQIIEDRPEGAYEGKYDGDDAAAAREIIRALFVAPAREDDPLDSEAEAQRESAEGQLALAVNELVLHVRGLPTAVVANLGRSYPDTARRINAVGAAHDALNR